MARRIIREAPAHLEAFGVLAMEIGADQSTEVAELFAQSGFVSIERTKDLAGIERVVSGIWQP